MTGECYGKPQQLQADPGPAEPQPGGGEVDFPSRVTIRDAIGAGNVTVLTYESPRAERHPPAVFNVNNVAR